VSIGRTVPKHRVFQCTIVRSVGELQAVADLRPWWVFRGQSSRLRLTPTLERECPDRTDWIGTERDEIARLKLQLAGQENVPADDDHLGWLGRLRHAGKPVRLLDFTRRLAVAVHFATSEESTEAPSIWAIDGYRLTVAWKRWITPPSEPLYIGSPYVNWTEFNEIYPSRDGAHAAMLVEPRAPNRRQVLQEALFLTGLNMRYTLEENLFGAFGHDLYSVIPKRNAAGVLTGPSGVNLKPLEGGGRRRIIDAHLVRIDLQIPRPDIVAYLESQAVSNQTLGFESPA
jgi:hypothetical protein